MSGGTDPGTERWRFETDDYLRSSPTVAGGTVYVGSDGGHLYTIRAATGDARATGGAPRAAGGAGTETQVYDAGCPECSTDLSDRESPAFCPACGARL
jgi:hypothetical protein